MKKLLFFFSFFLVAGLTTSVSAQSAKTCAKSCAKKCSKTASKTASATALSSVDRGALVLAEADETISYKECAKSGKVSFAKSYVCEESGAMTSKEVFYDDKLKAFVDVNPVAKDIHSGLKKASN